MKCPSCGANVTTAYCEYCGAKMPAERVETQTVQGEHVVVNNYYYYQQPSGAKPQQPSQAPYSTYVPVASSKSRLVALLLCFFLGMFGAHRFYAGRYLMGVLYFFTFGIFGIGYFVDLVLIILGRMKDKNDLYITNWSIDGVS